MSAPAHHVTVCVCTFKRPELLRRLLRSLPGLRTDGKFSLSVSIVDNDPARSAESVVQAEAPQLGLPVNYDAEPERSIALARNRSVRNATGDLIAFIDDDEFPEADWLLHHFNFLESHLADGVLGPVKPHFDDVGPAWLVRSGLLQRPAFPTGTELKDSGHTRTGNVLIWTRVFTETGTYFDDKFGRSGGSDAVFFKRVMQQGRRFFWCDEACVFETVPPDRQTRRYYLRRAATRGLTEAWETPLLSGSTARSLVAIPLYLLALPVLFICGQHLGMRYLVKLTDHLSKILGYVGIKLVPERPY